MQGARFGVAFAVSLLLFNAASAGPIIWGYSSTGNREGDYWFNGSTEPHLESAPGEVRIIPVASLIGSYSAPELISPIPLNGPTLTSRVTVLDAASGQSGFFDVPIVFFDNEPAPEGELDKHIPGLGELASQQLILGRNQYTVSGDPMDLYVTVDSVATPEPSTLALAGMSLAALGCLRRFRRTANQMRP